jgi:hypothetical protein
MKSSDTIELVLNSKDENRVLSVTSRSVRLSGDCEDGRGGRGSLLVITKRQTGRHPVGT